MNRRKVLKASLGTGAFVGITASVGWISVSPSEKELTINAALKELANLSDTSLISVGVWNTAQIFNHCAQSVEYSLTGYPQHKSELFKSSIGRIAFSAFSSKRKMTHGLSEPIPGAPKLISGTDLQQALERFKRSMLDFKQYTGRLEPHFAYGELSKSDYERAHVMHFYNHLNEIRYT